jgi:predicted enzyme related to lactoylglutathione lyase
MGLHLQDLLDRMSARLGARPGEVSPTKVRDAAQEAARHAEASGDVDGALWMEDGAGLLALAWSADPSGQTFTVWSMELRAEDRQREDG